MEFSEKIIIVKINVEKLLTSLKVMNYSMNWFYITCQAELIATDEPRWLEHDYKKNVLQDVHCVDNRDQT